MPENDVKAQALSIARDNILKLQEQMTDRILKMAAEVERLLAIVTPVEARSFLKARCNLPSAELSTYVGFATVLKGSEDVLRAARASFPVVKALVAADEETRGEILERMEIGAQIDTKDVAAMKRRVAALKLTASESLAAHNKKMVAAAARRHSKAAMRSFAERTSALNDGILSHFTAGRRGSEEIRARLRRDAGALLADFGILFGTEFPNSATNRVDGRMALARRVLEDISSGAADAVGATEFSALRALSGDGRVQMSGRRTTLEEIPPAGMRPRVLELCAGAGGLALGLERAGFDHVALIERDRNAAATLRANRPHWNVIEDDVRRMDFTQFRKQGVDLLAGGLPCTPFSTSGKRKGRRDENDLLMEGVKAVKEVLPKAFAFENVEGLLHAEHSEYVATLLRKLSKLGYETAIHRVNARDYAIAQNRSRILIVGLRRELASGFRLPPKFPEMATNMGEAVGDLMRANGWSSADDWIRAMREAGLRSDTIRGYQGSAQIGESRRALKNGVSYAPPAKTAPTDEQAAIDGFLPGLTNRMRARLQDFPDDWNFVGGLGSVADQIGNAVPPAVAQAVGLSLHGALRNQQVDWKKMMVFGRRVLNLAPPPLDPHDLLRSDVLAPA